MIVGSATTPQFLAPVQVPNDLSRRDTLLMVQALRFDLAGRAWLQTTHGLMMQLGPR